MRAAWAAYLASAALLGAFTRTHAVQPRAEQRTCSSVESTGAQAPDTASSGVPDGLLQYAAQGGCPSEESPGDDFSSCKSLGEGVHGVALRCAKPSGEEVIVKEAKVPYLNELLDEFRVMKKMQDEEVACVPRVLSEAPTPDRPCLYMEVSDGIPLKAFKKWLRLPENGGLNWKKMTRFTTGGAGSEAERVRQILDQVSPHVSGHDLNTGNFLIATKTNATCPVTFIDMPEFSYDKYGKQGQKKYSWWMNCCKLQFLWSKLDCLNLTKDDTDPILYWDEEGNPLCQEPKKE